MESGDTLALCASAQRMTHERTSKTRALIVIPALKYHMSTGRQGSCPSGSSQRLWGGLREEILHILPVGLLLIVLPGRRSAIIGDLSHVQRATSHHAIASAHENDRRERRKGREKERGRALMDRSLSLPVRLFLRSSALILCI